MFIEQPGAPPEVEAAGGMDRHEEAFGRAGRELNDHESGLVLVKLPRCEFHRAGEGGAVVCHFKDRWEPARLWHYPVKAHEDIESNGGPGGYCQAYCQCHDEPKNHLGI